MITTRPSLVIVGHGSSTSQEAERAAEEHALTLRQSRRFGNVITHFIQRGNVLPALPEGEVFILPFFMSDGFFVRKKIPEIFGLKDGSLTGTTQSLIQCDAIGVDPELADIIFDQVMERCRHRQLDAEETALLLVAHGSQKSSASREAAEFQASRLRKKKRFKEIALALLEEEPDICGALAQLAEKGVRHVILAGLFSANGPHAAEDVPSGIAKFEALWAAQGRSLPSLDYLGAVGARPEIVRLIQNSVSRRAAEVG